MPSTHVARNLSALCYEHHIEMRFGQIVLQTVGERRQILAYSCPERDCLVHCNRLQMDSWNVAPLPLGWVCPPLHPREKFESDTKS